MQSTGHKTPEFSERLRLLMYEQRKSVEALASETGIAGRLIRKYRAGDAEPRDYFGDPTANARKLAGALGIPVEQLIVPAENSTEETAA